jgi:hypothetical protein
MRDERESTEDRRQEEISRLVRELRLARGMGLEALVVAAKERGIVFRWEDLHPLASRLGWMAEPVPPRYVVDFLVAYFAGRGMRRALDPWAGTGTLLTALVASKAVLSGVGIVRMDDELAVAEAIGGTLPIEWLLGDPERFLRDKAREFDVVASFPPFNLAPLVKEFDTPSGPIRVRDSASHLLVLGSCQLLKEGGEGVFILPDAFLWNKPGEGVLASLPRFGLYVNAVLALPSGVWAPWTTISSNIVVVGRHQPEHLFVGQLDPARDSEPLLANLREHRPGRVREFGKLVDPSKFRSWRELVADEEIEDLAARSGVHPVRLADVAEVVNLGDRSEDGGFKDYPNAVFLPLIGNSPAVTSLDDLRIKPQNCAQIVIRSEAAFADYVAGFFNTPLGRKLRERLSGGFIPKITKRTLSDAILFLPPIEIQTKVVGVHRSIRELILQLEDNERALWSRPADAKKVGRAIASLNQKEAFESWIETLPFPLASILWRYHADAEPPLKNSHLLNCFEATAQFVACLMLSAFRSDRQFFHENKESWLDRDTLQSQAFRRSSFGDWVIFGERLAKFTRRMLSDKEQRALCLALYKTQRVDLIDALASKTLYAILKTVNTYRNDWKAHGGVESAKEQARRLALLESELARMREVFADSFSEWLLLRPDQSQYREGIFQYTATSLMGTRTIFRKVPVETSLPMEADKIYLLDMISHTPLEIVPFFRMMPGPRTEETACYFYNRIVRDGVRWVSYHFEQEAEVIRPDKALVELIQELEQGGE